MWNVKSINRKPNCDVCRPIRWNGMGEEDCRGQTGQYCGQTDYCDCYHRAVKRHHCHHHLYHHHQQQEAAASSSSAFVAPLEGHNLWFTCVNHFWSVATKCVCIWQAHIRPAYQPISPLCLPFPHGLLSFQFAGVSNCRRQKSPANRAQFINDSPPDTDSTSYTAVYRCGRVFDSKSHPTDTRPSDSSGWPAERGFVFVQHRGLSICKWHLSIEPDW